MKLQIIAFGIIVNFYIDWSIGLGENVKKNIYGGSFYSNKPLQRWYNSLGGNI